MNSLLAITAHNGIRIAEVGFALAAIGGAVIALGSVTPFGRRIGGFVGGVAIAAAGVLLVIATRWGHFG